MSITQQHTQEMLHRAYVLAVAAEAGLNINIGGNLLDYGVDIEVSSVYRQIDARGEELFIPGQVVLRMQLKATTRCHVGATDIHYNCEATAFNKIVLYNTQQGTIPQILVVFCQPTDRASWLTVSHEALTLPIACYWYYLAGLQTKNKQTQVIRIPRTQLFSSTALSDIINRIQNGGTP